MMKMKWFLALIIAIIWSSAIANKPMSDGEVRDRIIAGSISAFDGNCPCPYTEVRKNEPCGSNSGYSRSEGVKCYRSDISDQEVRQYRLDNDIPKPKLPWEIERKL